MRGTRLSGSFSSAILRIIPADAGNTGVHSLRACVRRDHPRGCGEHKYVFPVLAVSGGSSPRMRGTQIYKLLPYFIFRIIPADAGNTIV